MENTFYSAIPANKNMNGNNCGNEMENNCADQVLAMAYVPMQRLDTVYEPDVALDRGTLFPALDKPWMGGRHGE